MKERVKRKREDRGKVKEGTMEERKEGRKELNE